MEPMHKIPTSMIDWYNRKPKLDYCDTVLCHWRKGGDNFQIKVHHNVLRKILQVYGNQDTYPAQAYDILKTTIDDIEHVEKQEYEKINRQKEEYNEALEKLVCGRNPVTQAPHKQARKNRRLQIEVAWSSQIHCGRQR